LQKSLPNRSNVQFCFWDHSKGAFSPDAITLTPPRYLSPISGAFFFPSTLQHFCPPNDDNDDDCHCTGTVEMMGNSERRLKTFETELHTDFDSSQDRSRMPIETFFKDHCNTVNLIGPHTCCRRIFRRPNRRRSRVSLACLCSQSDEAGR
jgi:hypothetical protein